VGDALFMLRTEAMLELVGWMREFNRGRPDHDKVRFLGADVLELRPVQFDEIRRYVAEVASDRHEELEAHLAPIDWRGDPFTQLGWYTQLTAAEQSSPEDGCDVDTATTTSPSASPSTTARSSPAGRSSPAAPRSTTSPRRTSPSWTMSLVGRAHATT
jgi:hypothetical protein